MVCKTDKIINFLHWDIYICLYKAHIAFACRSFFSVLYSMYLVNYTIYYFIDYPLDLCVEG